MTIDVSTSYESLISPRISFSHDLNNQPSEISTTITATADIITFDFCITPNLVQPITSAHELFFEGVLLPTQIKNPEILNPKPKPKPVVSEDEVMDNNHKKRLKELLSVNDEKQEKYSSRSFWKFTRTTSLNSDNGGQPKRLFRSLSIKRMLRSNSTNSTLNPNGSEGLKVIEKSNSHKEPTMLPRCSTSIQTPQIHYSCNENKLRRHFVTQKNSGGGYCGGMKIIPMLNIPQACNMNLFGFGSLFCNGKPRNKTK